VPSASYINLTDDTNINSRHMTTPIEKVTPYDEFNVDVPENEFPKSGISARAAEAIVISDEWTDANPMLNMSSFVTTYAEPEAAETARRNAKQAQITPIVSLLCLRSVALYDCAVQELRADCDSTFMPFRGVICSISVIPPSRSGFRRYPSSAAQTHRTTKEL
jgi:hypothetical protein